MADKFGRVFASVSKPVTASMKAVIRTLPVILHPYASFSNGSSILAPRRIELFPKQPIALETNEFIPQLVIHEARHFAQMENLNSGVTKIAGYLLGDQAQSIILGIHVPGWLLEGDAVLTETLLSEAGRGRIASFMQPLRSRLIDNKDLSYDRVLFGSYRDVLPNQYLYGYFLTARGRMLADPMLWSDALRQIGRNPFNVKGLSGITRPKTGYRFSKLFVETLDWLHDYWTDPSKSVSGQPGLNPLAGDTLTYMNYFRPQQFDDQGIICLKKSLVDLPAFVVITPDNQEHIIARPGLIEDAGFSYNNRKILWAELIEDPRWPSRSWSEIMIYDCKSREKVRLTRGQRYFSPVFSQSGDSIAAINERPDGTSLIEILDTKTGNVLKSASDPSGNHFSYLCWGLGPQEVYAITTGPAGRTLVRLDLASGKQQTILYAGMVDITSPVVSGDWIYIAGPVRTTQGLYRVNRKTGILEIVFGHRHGINYLSKNGEELYFSVYSSFGYRPVKVNFSDLHGTPVGRVAPLEEPVTDIIQRAEGEFPIFYQDSAQQFKKQHYSKITHFLRLHSWSPVFVNPDSYQISPGIVLMSQNDLSNLTCWAGYQFNKPDLSHNLVASVRYTGIYPAIELDYSRKYRNFGEVTDTSKPRMGAYQQFLRAGAGIPLNFSSGAWTRKMQPTLFFEQIAYLNEGAPDTRSVWLAGGSFSASVLRNLCYRDLFPKWGYSMKLSLFKAYRGEESIMNSTARLMLYFPGLLPNSSLRILNSASMVGMGLMPAMVEDYPRGRLYAVSNNAYNLKVDYALPIAYPDYSLTWIIYIKRVKADFFFDASTPLYHRDWFTSTGIDLTLDYHLLRIGILLESGVRAMYFPASRKFGAEMLFGFSVK